MALLFETEPCELMPDQQKIKDHKHNVRLHIDFFPVVGSPFVHCAADLWKYYNWAKDNKIFMEHNILRLGQDGKRTLVMFVFENAEDATAFKLTWK